MEKRGVIKPGSTPSEHNDSAVNGANSPALAEKTAQSELDAIRELDGDFRKLAAERAKTAL